MVRLARGYGLELSAMADRTSGAGRPTLALSGAAALLAATVAVLLDRSRAAHRKAITAAA